MRPIIIAIYLSLLSLLQAGSIISTGNLQVKQVNPEAVTQVPLGHFLVGYMNPPASHYTISANTDSFVTAIHIDKYSSVRKGERLFTLKSPRLLELQAQYIGLLIDMDYYQKVENRLRPLAEKGVVASKRYLETKNKMLRLSASAESTKDIMRSYGMDKKTITKITRERKAHPYITLSAPAKMQIENMTVNSGDFLPQGKSLATLVDPALCHLEVELPWQTASTIKADDKLNSDNTQFSVISIAPTIDPRSQTKAIHLKMQESCDGRGGASINTMLFREKEAWRLPSNAVITLEGKNIIFKQEQSGHQVVEVTVLSRESDTVYVTGKLDKTMSIAASSLIALKSAAQAQQE